MTPTDRAFIDAIYADPADDGPRLAYADWLDDRGDPRAAYLRAEVEWVRKYEPSLQYTSEAPLWGLREPLDPVWVHTVSRVPFGIMIPGLTFTETGPPVTPEQVKALESHWGAPLLPDYVAFLLRWNGGRPSKPYIWTHCDEDNFWEEVFLFTTEDRHDDGQHFLTMTVADLHGGHVAARQDLYDLKRMIPIGNLTDDEGYGYYLTLSMDDENDWNRIKVVGYSEDDGLRVDRDEVWAESIVELFMKLCDRPAE